MFSQLKKLFRKTEVTHASSPEIQTAAEKDKSQQEESIEKWMSLGHHRKYDCVYTANKIEDITNQPILFDEKVSQAINLIYHDLKLDFVLLWTIESDCKFLYMGAGKNIHLMLAQREKINLQPDGDLVDRVVFNKKPTRARDLITDEDIPIFNGTPIPDIHSVVALPLFSSELIIGVLVLGSTIRLDFREDETDVFEYLAYQVAKLLSTR
jgi:transcriptional regulator with GAF, ATPase, and Fis domain